MMKAQALVERIHRLDGQMATSRQDLARKRREAVTELYKLVGAAEAARLLGITPAAVYKSMYAMKEEVK